MRPAFRVLSDDEMVQVHEASVRLLGKTGVRVEHEGARKMLLKAGGTKAEGKDIIKIPESLVDECMALVTDKHVRHLPVIDHGKVVGIVSIGDLVKAQIADRDFMIGQLTDYITGKLR